MHSILAEQGRGPRGGARAGVASATRERELRGGADLVREGEAIGPGAPVLRALVPGGTAMLDAQGRILEIDATLAALCGRPPAGLVGLELAHLAPQPARRRIEEAVRRALGAGAPPQSCELALRGGARVPLELEGLDAPGSLHASTPARTPSPPGEVGAELARLAQLGQLAAGIGHDLAQPLAAAAQWIGGALHRLGQQAEPDLRHALERARESVERAGDLVAGLRRSVARGADERRSFSLDALVAGVARLVQPEVERLGARLEVELGTGEARVRGDRLQLEQVLVNLCRNALEALASSGGARRIVSLATELRPDGRLGASVADSGPGVPPELARRIFETFATTKRGGSGLGLALGRSIAAAHGGRLELEDAPQGGARFVLLLPRHVGEVGA